MDQSENVHEQRGGFKALAEVASTAKMFHGVRESFAAYNEWMRIPTATLQADFIELSVKVSPEHTYTIAETNR